MYDASAKTKKESKSLNECLYRGPVLLQDLTGILLRFRLNRIALVADIEKAFLQVGLSDDSRDVTRFIWLRNREKLCLQNNIQEYRFCRVPFGIISSPFLLAATLEYPTECPANDTNTEEDNADRGRGISNNGTQDTQQNEPRPTRQAARKAQDRIKQTLKDI